MNFIFKKEGYFKTYNVLISIAEIPHVVCQINSLIIKIVPFGRISLNSDTREINK